MQTKPKTQNQMPAENAPDFNAVRGIEQPAIVTWGDSVANFIGVNLKRVFNHVSNLGVNGSGLDNGYPPLPVGAIAPGTVVLMSMGGNDVEGMIGQPQEYIDDYAKRVVAIAKSVRDQGATPILIGHGVPPAPYTGPVANGVSRWQEPGFLDAWVGAMHKMNEAISREAAKENITWSRVEGRVPRSEVAKDNLHYTVRGSRRIAANALKDAGIRIG